MTPRPERVALYARISQDELGNELGITRQLEDARELAASRGWEVIGEFTDNDISASNGAHRADYERVMKSAQAQEFDRIVVFHTSRLWRNRLQRVQGMETLQKALVSVTACKGPDLDLGSASGRMIANVLGEFDTMESEVKSERVARAARQRAERGEPNGAIPYGWQRVVETDDKNRRVGAHDVLDPETAPVVREICTRLLDAQSLRAVTEWLNESGVPAPGAAFDFRSKARGRTNATGERWGKNSVKKLALRPANAGVRMYHAGRPDEQLMDAKIEPIISRDQWESLRAMLTDPARLTGRNGGRKHLLTSGIGACGVCGSDLRVALKGHAIYGTKEFTYVCADKGCVGRNQASVDNLVSELVIKRLSQPDALDLLAGDDDGARVALDKASGLRARLDLAADQYADGKITMAQLTRITDRLTPQIRDADREAQAARPAVPITLLRGVAGEHAAQRWESLDISQRRAVVETLLRRVVVNRVMKRGPGFDPNSVTLEWVGA